jgi:archaellum biogenesis ATPase FlaH
MMPVDSLHTEINDLITSRSHLPGVYVSLNKTQKSMESQLIKTFIPIDKLFFIDCVTSQKIKDDVLHISPTDLVTLRHALRAYMAELRGERFILIDALSTLLIYNDVNKVASFMQSLTDLAGEKDIEVIALSPHTKGEELLDKIFNFFDTVEKKGP